MGNMHMEFDSLEYILGGSESPRHLKLPFLQFITKNFSDELIIGIGGCRLVYKVNYFLVAQSRAYLIRFS